MAVGCLALLAAVLSVLRSRTVLRGPIVIYLVDTLRADRMSAYGASRETSPAASAMARDGVLFEHAYSVSTWTRPSVATILTSLLPEETSTLNRRGLLARDIEYLPDLLRRAGWTTAAFTGNGNIFDTRLGFDRGFDTFRAASRTEQGWKAPARVMVEQALEFVARQKSPKFFLFVHVVDPHLPYISDTVSDSLFAPSTPPASPRESLLPGYDRMVRQADDQFGRLAEALRRRGWWKGALIVYTSDHGEEFYEHGGQGHGRTIFEEQTRIPLILKLPGNRAAGTRRSDLVSLTDITPTIAALAKAPASRRWIGENLTDEPHDRARVVYFSEDLDDVRVYGARRGAQKVIVNLYPTLDRSFFDLARDPEEKRGRGSPCGAPPSGSDVALYSAFQALHARTIAAEPGVAVERLTPGRWDIDLLANLKEARRPFVSFEQACEFGPDVRGPVVEIRRILKDGAPFSLKLAGDDMGRLPEVRLRVTDGVGRDAAPPGERSAPFRITRTAANYVTGETTDELLQHLRALGYLAGGSR